MSFVYVCVCVPLRKPCFSVDWRPLVTERIANIDIPLDIFRFCCFNDFWDLNIFGFLGLCEPAYCVDMVDNTQGVNLIEQYRKYVPDMICPDLGCHFTDPARIESDLA